MSEPVFVSIRAADVKPYQYGVWSCVGGSPFFANAICTIRWSEDGKQLIFGLESHNFYFCDPEAVVDLVSLAGVEAWKLSQVRYAGWTLPPAPVPASPTPRVCRG